ncbi:PAS-domain containing protein [Thalassovita sp.]|jgi:PAS domain-containing protein|uniref:PAS-domain containing protein n=1 Tax=Thalassovita sp. TaxID=1979401 RepID=UPI003B58CE36
MLSLSATVFTSIISASAATAAMYYLFRNRRTDGNDRTQPDHDIRYLFQGPDLLNVSGGGEWLFESGHGFGNSDWEQLRHVLLPRFPGFPTTPEDLDTDIVSFPASVPGDDAELLFERINTMTRITVLHPNGGVMQAADLHQRLVSENRVGLFEQAVDNSPFPIWSTDKNGQMIWANPAYLQLAGNVETDLDDDLPPLFSVPPPNEDSNPRQRASVALKDSDSNIWFDVTSVATPTGGMHYAIDVNPVVQAEIAQRNFVQTLTKTFAQLSIGLAIFDRKRQLALFNPALTDLNHLSPEFLSARPTLFSFFDKLRDSRIMPEPKDYSSWREKMSDLVLAATDGRYHETWNLPNGLTYRVTGRPHPDGAVAFLFEDISSEVAATRRYRSQLDDLHALLDGMPQAIAFFAANQTLTFANEAYRDLWGCDPDVVLEVETLEQSIRAWSQSCIPGTDFSALKSGDPQTIQVTLTDGRRLVCKVKPMPAGKFAISFEPMRATLQPSLALPA